MGHLVGFPVTLGGLKVDGEGKNGLFRYSRQIGALLFGLLAAGVQLPAVREGAPWSLLEAMAFEKPIVAYDLNGMHDTLSPEGAILVNIDGKTPSEAKDAFLVGMQKLLCMSRTEKDRMGLAARKRLETVHSAAGVKNYIQTVIDSIV